MNIYDRLLFTVAECVISCKAELKNTVAEAEYMAAIEAVKRSFVVESSSRDFLYNAGFSSGLLRQSKCYSSF